MRLKMYVDRLSERQAREGWSHRRMAEEIGVHHTTWFGILRGRHDPGMIFMRRAMARFPEYNAVALFCLQSDVSHDHISDGENHHAVA